MLLTILLISLLLNVGILAYGFYTFKKPHRHNPKVYDLALDLIKYHDHAHRSQSGEWRRHQVYAQLIKKFPSESKAKISLCIEEIVNDLRTDKFRRMLRKLHV